MARKHSLDYYNAHRSTSSSSSSTSSSSLLAMFLTVLKVLSFILLYWCCSISLTFFNRHLFRDYKFPLTITTSHMAMKFLFAALIRWFLHRFCFHSRCVKLCGQHQNNDRERVHLTWPVLWRKIAPTGLFIGFFLHCISFLFSRNHCLVRYQFIKLVFTVHHNLIVYYV